MSRVPRIRFKGFEEDWEQRKLGDIASSFEYGLNAAAKEYDGENKYIRITDIDDNTHEFLTDGLTSPDIDLNGAENYKLAEGDILFARTGASVGKSYIYKNSDGLVYYAGFLIRARIKEEYDAEFIFQNTLTEKYNKYIAVTSQRSGQPGVNAQEYSEFEIQVLKKEEQTKIGTYFSNLDHLITLHQRKLEKLKIIKKSMLENLFPQNGEKTPKIRFSGFTKDWEQRKLGEVTTSFSGGTPNIGNHDYYGDEIPFIRSGEINNCHTDLFITEKGLVNSSAAMVKEGDILYALYGATSGEVSRSKLKGAINQAILAILPKAKYDSEYIAQWLKTKKRYIVDTYLQGGQGNLSGNIVKNFIVDFSSYNEQLSIGNFASSLDHLITLHQSKLEKLQKIKKSMLESMFV